MLSSLSKLADRRFIIGFFLPGLLFCCAMLAMFSNDPGVRQIVAGLEAKDLGVAVFVVIAIWVVGVVLLAMNTPLFRMLEGYWWPLNRDWARQGYRSKFESKLASARALAERWEREGDDFPRADIDAYMELQQWRTQRMPSRVEDVLATRFGNAIRAFEVYPRDMYGADGPTVWWRLLAVVPREFLDRVFDAKSEVDFLINLSFFGCVTSLIALLDGSLPLKWAGFLWIIGGIAVGRGAYLWATSSVEEWGALVKSAFDCYLGDLATRLGYEVPVSDAERRRFWTAFSQAVGYGQDLLTGSLPFVPEDWPRKR